MAIVNVSKPNSSIANQTKINIGETWATDLNTWATETHTWDSTGSVIDNITKSYSGYLWADSTLPWQLATPWMDTNRITNVNRP